MIKKLAKKVLKIEADAIADLINRIDESFEQAVKLILDCDGRVVVTRTRDGGKSFEVLCNGLPQEHAYDITFRHGLDVDETGDRLAFGSTTGSLWMSEDQGDSFACLSHHLPPVYCVHFAG